MKLNLRIENLPQLPDGGPLTYSLSGPRGLDIGRDAHLDWSLPDPSRHVSGKHCEIRYQDGGYMLYDVSRNGTYLNGSDNRMQSPYRLRSGDRLLIGHYIVGIEVEEAAAAAPGPPAPPQAEAEDPWSGALNAAPPADPRDLRSPEQMAPVRPDFLEWAVDVPDAPGSGFVARPVSPMPAGAEPRPEPMSWDAGRLPSGPEPEPEPPAPVPTPRRSIWVGSGPEGPWRDGSPDPEPPPVAPPQRMAPPPGPSRPVQESRPEIPGSSAFGARFAKGAGLPADGVARREAGDMAEWLGRLMLLVTDNLKQLLEARGQTKRLVRSSNQTMIAALDNNPLKFSPTAAEALKILMGPSTRSYLDAEQALQQAFDDLKSHQVKTFAAMQRALTLLLDDLDPKTIEGSLGPGKAGWFRSRRAQLWVLYETRWRAKTAHSDKGLQDLFMQHFAECYDQMPQPPGQHRSI